MQEILDDISPQHEKRAYVAASTGQRFGNYIVDLIGYTILSALIGIVIAVVNPESSFFDETGSSAADVVIEWIFSAIIIIIYYTLSEFFLEGKTLGKFITRTRAVSIHNERLDFEMAFKRSACRLIPFEQFSFLGDGASGWHDTIPKTKVIKDDGWVDPEGEYI